MMRRAPLRSDDRQRPRFDHAERYPSIFAIVFAPVVIGDGRSVENADRVLEIDAVIADVLGVLGVIPFKLRERRPRVERPST